MKNSEIIKKLKLCIEAEGDGGILMFTSEEKEEMLCFIDSLFLSPSNIYYLSIESADKAIEKQRDYVISARADWLNGYHEGFLDGVNSICKLN